MANGKQKRIDPDLIEEVDQYNGRNFTEKLLNWKLDVDKVSQSVDYAEIEEIIESKFEKYLR